MACPAARHVSIRPSGRWRRLGGGGWGRCAGERVCRRGLAHFLVYLRNTTKLLFFENESFVVFLCMFIFNKFWLNLNFNEVRVFNSCEVLPFLVLATLAIFFFFVVNKKCFKYCKNKIKYRCVILKLKALFRSECAPFSGPLTANSWPHALQNTVFNFIISF